MTDQTIQSRSGVAETLVEQVITLVRAAIRSGEFAPGQRLVVADLSKRYGVSVGPAREAIRRLAGEGLLDFTPHRGATVRNFDLRRLRETFQVREALEGYAARLAAENIHKGRFAEQLQDWIDRMREIVGAEDPGLTDVRQTFHELLYEIAGNQTLGDAAMRHHFPMERRRFNERMGPGRARDSLREHEMIVDAILAGDGVRAERMMRTHLRNAVIAIAEVIDDG